MTPDRPHGHRRSIRLPGYDYAQPGAYFVTICTDDGECLFDDPVLRRVAETMWQQIPSHFGRVTLDAWVVMPNHTHGVLILSDIPGVGARHSQQEVPLTTPHASVEANGKVHDLPGNASPARPSGAPAGSLGVIVGNYKSITTRRINQIRKTPGTTVWQRSYYEHIVRSERALDAIRAYITTNPARWHLDKYNALSSGKDPLAEEVWRLLRQDTR
jgi:REP element-mobilizing transposase RayT